MCVYVTPPYEDDAGLIRERVFITNAVKHFKNVPCGKRRDLSLTKSTLQHQQAICVRNL